MENEKVDLNPYLDSKLVCVFADWLYKAVFEPIFNWFHSFSEARTRKWCENELLWIAQRAEEQARLDKKRNVHYA